MFLHRNSPSWRIRQTCKVSLSPVLCQALSLSPSFVGSFPTQNSEFVSLHATCRETLGKNQYNEICQPRTFHSLFKKNNQEKYNRVYNKKYEEINKLFFSIKTKPNKPSLSKRSTSKSDHQPELPFLTNEENDTAIFKTRDLLNPKDKCRKDEKISSSNIEIANNRKQDSIEMSSHARVTSKSKAEEILVCQYHEKEKGKVRCTIYTAPLVPTSTEVDTEKKMSRNYFELSSLNQKDTEDTQSDRLLSLRQASAGLERAVKALLPRAYPHSVHQGYMEYTVYNMIGSIASSSNMVLSTQALLYAMGLGAGALPLAATLNWVIKDGIGQLGGIIFASTVNDRFDAEPKRWRMVADIALNVSCLIELLSPAAPSYFLLIASSANIGKNICFLSASASRAAIHNSFVKRGNLADITAKSGSQSIVTSIVGTSLGIFLSSYFGASGDVSQLLPVFLTLSSIHLSCTYFGLHHVAIHTVNQERFDLIMDEFLLSHTTPTPFQIAPKEKILSKIIPLLPKSIYQNATQVNTINSSTELHVNPPLLGEKKEEETSSGVKPWTLHALSQSSIFKNEKYILMGDFYDTKEQNDSKRKDIVSLFFKTDATNIDVIKGHLHAAMLRKELALSRQHQKQSESRPEASTAVLSAYQSRIPKYSNFTINTKGHDLEAREREMLDLICLTHVEMEGRNYAPLLLSQLKKAGWETDYLFIDHARSRICFEIPEDSRDKKFSEEYNF